jgi:hypothetical protein
LPFAEEAFMHTKSWIKGLLWVCALNAGASAVPRAAFGQGANAAAESNADGSTRQVDLAGVASTLRQLQAQVQQLNDQVKSLKAEQESARSESAVLRKELDATKTQLMAFSGQPAGASEPVAAAVAPNVSTTEERINKLEENQQLADQKIAEQNQTKVESGSKYRLRLSGIVLFNMYENRGTVENQDFPQLATPGYALSSDGSFGGSLRQSQIEIQGFGPTVAGARTSADVQFDFAGGFPDAPNGVTFGLMRLRTGTVRFDWDKTSVIAGQDTLFIAPMAPTSIATLAVPALAYAGNLWAWTPQVRVEHHFTLSDHSSLLLQAGILDSLTGDLPPVEYYRYPSWGESSGQPAYATRLAWTKEIHGQNMTLGAGGYYGRQDWGFGRSVDGWAGTLDLSLPLGKNFAFSSQFYRGRAIGGLGGGIGQTVVWNGSLLDPTTQVVGLNSIGGWAQLKYRATTKLEFNGAFGMDNPFAGDLREYGGSQNYYESPLSRNQSALVNFLYQPRSDIVLSLEYRRLKTFTLDSSANTGNIINFSVGYIF